MMVKFEKTGQLDVLPGRGRKRINTAESTLLHTCDFPTAWTSRSFDLTPLESWLWGCLKDNVYRKSKP
ncbi:UNVERIFIED_CONTAM: hypothetical protein NCL1_38526 [Trichonephila clavipes]